MDQEKQTLCKQYLVQHHVEIDSLGGGAWISLKIFQSKEEAEKFSSKLDSGMNKRIVEVVCESHS